jgi:hypothetical protein
MLHNVVILRLVRELYLATFFSQIADELSILTPAFAENYCLILIFPVPHSSLLLVSVVLSVCRLFSCLYFLLLM